MWSKKYNKCVLCKTTKIKYAGNGMCISCYNKNYHKNNLEKEQKRSKKWREKNPERIKENSKNYYKNNSEKRKEYSKKYYKENPECSRNWARKNPEKIKEKNRKQYIKNIEEQKEHSKKYRKENPEKVKKYMKKYRKENSEKIKKISKKYKKKNYEKYKEYNRKYNNNKRSINIHCRLRHNVSSSMRIKLKRHLFSKNKQSTFSFLPYTVDELKQHLEKQFEPWMNWSNYGNGKGKWSIDHKIPDCNFNYRNVKDKEFQKCWSLGNLQPLDFIKNSTKGGKII